MYALDAGRLRGKLRLRRLRGPRDGEWRRGHHVTYTLGYTPRHELASKLDSRLGRSLAWTYDPAGNVKTRTGTEGDVTECQFDSTNRLVALRNAAFLQVSYHYDPAGRLLARILSNGARTRYGYDDDDRLTSLRSVAADGTLLGTCQRQ